MTEIQEYKTIITTLIEQNEVAFVIVFQIPFWLKTFINSGIINKRDKTRHFILFLNPVSQDAWEHGLECFLRFYWKPVDQSIVQKKIVNGLSLIFGLFIIGTIINVTTEYWMNK